MNVNKSFLRLLLMRYDVRHVRINISKKERNHLKNNYFNFGRLELFRGGYLRIFYFVRNKEYVSLYIKSIAYTTLYLYSKVNFLKCYQCI